MGFWPFFQKLYLARDYLVRLRAQNPKRDAYKQPPVELIPSASKITLKILEFYRQKQ